MIKKELEKSYKLYTDSLSPKIEPLKKYCISHLLHVFLLISLNELTPITYAYQWNAHDYLE